MKEALRKDERIRSPGHVTFTRRHLGEGLVLEGTGSTLDLSEHGIRIESSERLAVGDFVHLDVMLAGERVEVDAYVARVGKGPPHEIGMRFEGLGPTDQAKIRAYLTERRPGLGLLG